MLALRPDYVEALVNRGNPLHALNRFEEALATYDHALALRPDYVEALVDRGSILHKLKRFEEALASYGRALALRPDYVEAHYNEGMSRMLTGDFQRGWPKMEWGWIAARQKFVKRNFPATAVARVERDRRQDRPAPCRARVWRHDSILPLCTAVAERGARVIFEVYEPLRELMSTLPGVAQIVSTGEPLPDFDMHCPLMSLPLALGAGVRDHTVANALSAGIATGGDGLERPVGAATSTQNRPRLVRPAVAR